MAINREDLSIRTVVGAVYVIIAATATLLSWYTTVAFIAVIAALCCYEFLRMAQYQGYHPYIFIASFTAALIPLTFGILVQHTHIAAAGLVICFLAGIVMLLRYFARDEDTIVDVTLSLFGYFYTGLTLSAFILLRSFLPGIEGGLLGLMVLLSVWANDAFAYLGGSAFGRHRFAPKISPKKSIEGVICGIVFSMLFWLLIPVVVPACGFGYVWAAIAGLLCGISGVIGDLTESHMKRGFQAKDSGDIMPGHGGMLDRTDSLIFVSVVAYAMIAGAPYIFGIIGVTL